VPASIQRASFNGSAQNELLHHAEMSHHCTCALPALQECASSTPRSTRQGCWCGRRNPISPHHPTACRRIQSAKNPAVAYSHNTAHGAGFNIEHESAASALLAAAYVRHCSLQPNGWVCASAHMFCYMVAAACYAIWLLRHFMLYGCCGMLCYMVAAAFAAAGSCFNGKGAGGCGAAA
jgi:hypothetical protein